MKKTTYQPYNNIFVKTMSIPDFVEKLINHFGGDLKSKIKANSYELATETFIDEVLKPHLPDVIYQVKYEKAPAWLFLLFEHKSYPEHPKAQTGRYIFNGLHQQRLKWEQANAQRKKNSQPPLKNFKYKIILPIILYHGKSKWTDRPFSDLFDMPDESFLRYLPDFDYILIDLNKYTDEYIENIGDSLLSAILLLLKYKGDKEYVMRSSQKLFKFVEDHPNMALTKDFLKTLMEFIYQTCQLSQEEIIEMATELPSNIQRDFVSAWDRALAEGEAKGKEIGKEIGAKIGKQETETRKSLEITLSLLKELPQLSDDLIASIGKVAPIYVKEVRKVFARTRSTSIKRYIRRLFKQLPEVDETKWKELEKWGIVLWKEYRKK